MMDEKELIEKVRAYAEGLIVTGEYEDNSQQLVEFARNELGAIITARELDRMAVQHLSCSSIEDMISRMTAEIRRKQHPEHEAEGRYSVQRDSCLNFKINPPGNIGRGW